MAVTVHYEPEFTAQGGPPPGGPNLTEMYGIPIGDILSEPTSATIAILWVSPGSWVVVDGHTGQVYAEADDPADLVAWMTSYLDAISHELHEQGVLSY